MEQVFHIDHGTLVCRTRGNQVEVTMTLRPPTSGLYRGILCGKKGRLGPYCRKGRGFVSAGPSPWTTFANVAVFPSLGAGESFVTPLVLKSFHRAGENGPTCPGSLPTRFWLILWKNPPSGGRTRRDFPWPFPGTPKSLFLWSRPSALPGWRRWSEKPGWWFPSGMGAGR